MLHLHELSFVSQTQEITLPLTLLTDHTGQQGPEGNKWASHRREPHPRRHCFLKPDPPLTAEEYHPSSPNFFSLRL